MVARLLLLWIFVDITISQSTLEIPIGNGESCTGKSGSIQQRPDKQIAYDLNNLYDSKFKITYVIYEIYTRYIFAITYHTVGFWLVKEEFTLTNHLE